MTQGSFCDDPGIILPWSWGEFAIGLGSKLKLAQNRIILHPRSSFIAKIKALDELYRSRGVPGYIGAIQTNKTTLFFCMAPFLTGGGGDIFLYGFCVDFLLICIDFLLILRWLCIDFALIFARAKRERVVWSEVKKVNRRPGPTRPDHPNLESWKVRERKKHKIREAMDKTWTDFSRFAF